MPKKVEEEVLTTGEDLLSPPLSVEGKALEVDLDQDSLGADLDKDDKGYTESSIEWYLEEINKIPLLTREEEDALARRVVQGDQEAKNKLILANLRFVVQVAKRYQKYGISLLDLINEGNMGLIKAAERFDPNMGYHFISYAVWWIRQAIILAINQRSSMIRLPMNRTIDLNRIEKTAKELEFELAEEPTIAQIAARLDMSEEEVQWLRQISQDYVSLDAPLANDSENTQMSLVQDVRAEDPEEKTMNKALQKAINEILAELTESERQIIEYRFGLNGKPRLSLTQAGKKFKLSKERVRQIEKKTLQKLKKYGQQKQLEAFLK
ncbi:MAG: RNA polymerase sigma factor RpoD/SigA [Leptospiraceae bacterium]|nr:RNA polymerase sigma factor RpoD/SigA [Leptospiraceae bacterium]MDW8307384.1 RNA polymerase sigma factor RpoD/SigA [Leptospiraceae bacterium]